MKCPKCGFEQTSKGVECQKCGIIFSKYLQLKENKPQRTPSPIPTTPITTDRWQFVNDLLF
jgi:tRNA(Ile2) C34 agmatinyltransferase TiaS